jgi:hypothetical protein
MSIALKMKRIGFVGIVDSRPDFGYVFDEYCDGIGVAGVTIYRSKKEARKRFEKVLPVYIPTLEKGKS